MIRNFCTLLAIVMAVSVAFAAPLAEAQGQPACVSVFLAEPEPPAPTPIASDDDTVDGNDTIVGSAQAIAATNCADAKVYPGPFTTMPTVPASPYSVPVGITVAPAPVSETSDTVTGVAATTTTTPLSGRDLAHSGTETFVLAYLGTGLLAFGAFAMGIRRDGSKHRDQL